MQQKELRIGFQKKNILKQIRPQFLGPSSEENIFCLQNAHFHKAVFQNSSEDNEKAQQRKCLKATWLYFSIPHEA